MFKMGPNHRINHRIQEILWSKLTKYSEFGLEIVGFSDLFVTIQRSSKQISQKSCITDICQGPKTPLSLQTHHVYSTLKRCGNDRFHVVSMWNTHGVFVGLVNRICCYSNPLRWKIWIIWASLWFLVTLGYSHSKSFYCFLQKFG